MTFHPNYPVAKLKGAEYNPRKITPEAFEELRKSVRTIGTVKPIIVGGDVVVAGHQRSKALRAEGIEFAPVIILDHVNQQDEIRFNQLHNATDIDGGGCTVPPGPTGVFELVQPGDIHGDLRSPLANIRTQMVSLLLRYGQWGACVADADGNVFHADQYALACKLTDTPCLVFRVGDAKLARELLSGQYGDFSYDHIPRTTYAQSLAQPSRFSPKVGSVQNRSNLYDKHLVPNIQKTDRVLDFGCGRGDYVTLLKGRGYDIRGIEFFPRSGPTILTGRSHKLVSDGLADLADGGLFDAVICDKVINSIDTMQAHADVFETVAALCKPGGLVCFSGRLADFIRKRLKQDKSGETQTRRYVEFLDPDNISATYRAGVWTYQKFHERPEVGSLSREYFGEPDKIEIKDAHWWTRTCKTVVRPQELIEAALRREFNLPLPNGASVGMGEEAVEAYRTATARAGAPV